VVVLRPADLRRRHDRQREDSARLRRQGDQVRRPTCFQRGDNFYRNQNGELIAKQRSTGIRYRPAIAQETVSADQAEEPAWTDEQIAALEDRKFVWVRMLHDLGHGRRNWDEVQIGDVLPERVFGPHTVASLTTEWRAYLFTIWGGTHRINPDFAAMGFELAMAGHENDGWMVAMNTEITVVSCNCPSSGHQFSRWACHIGMPRAYGYGASMGAWLIDYLAGWAGEWGQVVHSNANYRGPALSGDITIITAAVVDKLVDAEGRKLVQVDCRMTNQFGVTLVTGTAEVQLDEA